MDILFAQSLWVLDLLDAAQLPDVGVKALEVGMDSRALRMLASLMQDEVDEAPKLFEEALKELSMPLLDRPNAARICAKAISMKILSGELSPQDGANRLWDVSIKVHSPNFHDLDTFIYAASEISSRPEDLEFFNREIVKEAELWAEKPDFVVKKG